MLLRARLRLRVRYAVPEAAAHVARALAPDNVRVPRNLFVRTRVRARVLEVEVAARGRLERLASTAEEVMSHLQVVSRTLAATGDG